MPHLSFNNLGVASAVTTLFGKLRACTEHCEVAGSSAAGEIRWSSSTQNKETFDYDSLGRLITHDRWVDGRNYEMSYNSFDALHRPANRVLTWPNGNTDTVSVTYDHEGENTLSGGGSSLVSAVGYNDMGQLKRVALGNSLTTWYGYGGYQSSANNDSYDAKEVSWSWGASEDFGRLWRICTAPTAANPNLCLADNKDQPAVGQKMDVRHSYDDVGNVVAIRDYLNDNQVQTFGYDHLNRLETAVTTDANGFSAGQYDHFYVYNKLGNITSYDGLGYGYSSLHKHAVSSVGSASYGYDLNGNMTSRIEGGTTTTQNFNVENELTSVVNNGSTTTFAYDASGIRTKTVSPSSVTTYYPFPGYEEEVNGSTTTRRITYSAAGQAIALRVQIMSGSNTLYYLHSDHLGSTSLMTNSTNGGLVSGSTARYYPFGGWRTEPTANLTDRGFTGHLHNNLGNGSDDIGLVYMQARWYLPGVGRFASADTIVPNPADPQSYNRYSYVRNQPLTRIDPTGHMDELGMDTGSGGGLPAAPAMIMHEPEALATIEGEAALIEEQAGAFAESMFDEAIGAVETGFQGLADDAAQFVDDAVQFVDDALQGEFSIIKWEGYPEGVPQPDGPFRLLEGSEYAQARSAANAANSSLHRADPALNGLQIHEIQPVKFGGNPTDIGNKIALPPSLHRELTTWWYQLQRLLTQ